MKTNNKLSRPSISTLNCTVIRLKNILQDLEDIKEELEDEGDLSDCQSNIYDVIDLIDKILQN